MYFCSPANVFQMNSVEPLQTIHREKYLSSHSVAMYLLQTLSLLLTEKFNCLVSLDDC